MNFVSVLAVGLGVSSFAQAEFRLVQPVDCVLQKTCVIQQFMDHLPDSGAADFACGAASYDGHKGTDFRVSPGDMKRGVNVLAAADGVVVGLRNTMPDKRIETEADGAAVASKECGNGVVLRHEDGYETQYCHMKQGSVVVQNGQHVSAGAVLGQVGLSGKTQFPHVHLSVRKDGAPIDPFAPHEAAGSCRYDATDTLWEDGFAAQFAYQPTVLAQFGMADGAVDMDDVTDGVWEGFVPKQAAPLVLYGLAVNGQTGDQLALELRGPEGVIAQSNGAALDRRKAQWFAFAGKKAPAGGWPAGQYSTRVQILRGGVVLDSRESQFTLP